MNAFIQQAALFFQMAQEAITTESTPTRRGLDPREVLKAERQSAIMMFTIFLEGTGLRFGGKDIGWIRYLRFSMEGYCQNGDRFFISGAVGQRQDSENWNPIGLKLKLEGITQDELRVAEADTTRYDLSISHIYVGSLVSGDAKLLHIEMAAGQDYMSSAIESFRRLQAENDASMETEWRDLMDGNHWGR